MRNFDGVVDSLKFLRVVLGLLVNREAVIAFQSVMGIALHCMAYIRKGEHWMSGATKRTWFRSSTYVYDLSASYSP